MDAGYEQYDDRPVYVISVAAELAGMHPQTLRAYDRIGLVSPGRTGRARRYSARDVARLQEIARLSQQEGLGLAAISRIFALQAQVAELRAQVTTLAEELVAAQESARAQVARALAEQHNANRRDLVPVDRRPGQQVVVWRRRPPRSS